MWTKFKITGVEIVENHPNFIILKATSNVPDIKNTKWFFNPKEPLGLWRFKKLCKACHLKPRKSIDPGKFLGKTIFADIQKTEISPTHAVNFKQE